MAYLILVRHGESLWNKEGKWTGFTDIELSEKGHDEAKEAGSLLKKYPIDLAYVSVLKRAKQTLDDINATRVLPVLEVIKDKALNERDYGDFTGKNKWEVKKQVGDETFTKIRRSWDYPIPNGESLKDVYNRVIPYYKKEIEPKLKMGKNILISAHSNSLRALVKYLENISDIDIPKLEIATGEIYVYQIDKEGKIVSKEIIGAHPNTA